MTRTAAQAIAHVARQSTNGPKFEPNYCKRETREAYLVPSDGSGSATQAFARTRHRLSAADPWTPGALAWWVGGSNGEGHVAICDTRPGYVWSVDIRRPGYWDRVLLASINAAWPQLRESGFSCDIDGVQVVTVAKPATTATRITRARARYQRDRVVDLALLDAAVAAGRTGAVKRTRDQIDTLIRQLFEDVPR